MDQYVFCGQQHGRTVNAVGCNNKIKKRGESFMKSMVNHTMVKLGALLASAAMLLAISSVGSACVFMLYQPDVPEELREHM